MSDEANAKRYEWLRKNWDRLITITDRKDNIIIVRNICTMAKTSVIDTASFDAAVDEAIASELL